LNTRPIDYADISQIAFEFVRIIPPYPVRGKKMITAAIR